MSRQVAYILDLQGRTEERLTTEFWEYGAESLRVAMIKCQISNVEFTSLQFHDPMKKNLFVL